MTTAAQQFDSNMLERTIRRIARPPHKSRALAHRRFSEAKAKAPKATQLELKTRAAKSIVRGHALRSGVAGGGTGMIGLVPGPWTAVAITAGVATDIVLQMKVNVDMCQALVHIFKPELDDEQGFSYAVSLACLGTLEKIDGPANRAVGVATKVASKAGVKVLRQQLRGSTLIATKQAFKRIGIVLTRKAVEKAIPFGVGAVIGSTVNAGITTYVGHQAHKHLEIEAVTE